MFAFFLLLIYILLVFRQGEKHDCTDISWIQKIRQAYKKLHTFTLYERADMWFS